MLLGYNVLRTITKYLFKKKVVLKTFFMDLVVFYSVSVNCKAVKPPYELVFMVLNFVL